MAELDFVEIQVADLARSVAWFVAALGLRVVLDDPPGRFALLEAGPVRLALKGGGPGGDRDAIRLVFRVADVDAERARLLALGVVVGEPITNPAEGYRAVRLADPDGTQIRLFSWDPAARALSTTTGTP